MQSAPSKRHRRPAAWECYGQVLAAWRKGDSEARFPGGEDCNELCARLRRALMAVARRASAARSLVVAHGASLRAALPGLAGQPDPGTDLPTGWVAALQVEVGEGPHPSVRLLGWPGAVPG